MRATFQSPALAAYEQQWTDLHSKRDVRIDGSWQNAEAIAAQLLATSTTREDRDATLLELIAAAQTGDTTASHTVLRFMRPTIASNSRLLLAHSRGMSRTDAMHYAISAAWEAIAQYPHTRWLRSVAMNLRQQSRKILAADFAATPELPVDSPTLELVIESSQQDTHRSLDDDLATVLLWARDNEIVSTTEVRQLMAYGLDDAAVHDLLEELGISRQTLKKRNQRTVQRLRAAVQDRIREYGHLELD